MKEVVNVVVVFKAREDQRAWFAERSYTETLHEHGFFYQVFELAPRLLDEGISVWEIPRMPHILSLERLYVCVREGLDVSDGGRPCFTVASARDGSNPQFRIAPRGGEKLVLHPGNAVSVRAYGSREGRHTSLTVKEYVLRQDGNKLQLSVRVYRGSLEALIGRCQRHVPKMLVALAQLHHHRFKESAAAQAQTA